VRGQGTCKAVYGLKSSEINQDDEQNRSGDILDQAAPFGIAVIGNTFFICVKVNVGQENIRQGCSNFLHAPQVQPGKSNVPKKSGAKQNEKDRTYGVQHDGFRRCPAVKRLITDKFGKRTYQVFCDSNGLDSIVQQDILCKEELSIEVAVGIIIGSHHRSLESDT